MNKKQKNRKTVTQNTRNRMVNRRYRSTMKSLSKLFLTKVNVLKTSNSGTQENIKLELKTLINSLFSIIDKSVKKGVIHKNNAARRKSAISSISNAL
jgi:small subunit ribosomal protein S20